MRTRPGYAECIRAFPSRLKPTAEDIIRELLKETQMAKAQADKRLTKRLSGSKYLFPCEQGSLPSPTVKSPIKPTKVTPNAMQRVKKG